MIDNEMQTQNILIDAFRSYKPTWLDNSKTIGQVGRNMGLLKACEYTCHHLNSDIRPKPGVDFCQPSMWIINTTLNNKFWRRCSNVAYILTINIASPIKKVMGTMSSVHPFYERRNQLFRWFSVSCMFSCELMLRLSTTLRICIMLNKDYFGIIRTVPAPSSLLLLQRAPESFVCNLVESHTSCTPVYTRPKSLCAWVNGLCISKAFEKISMYGSSTNIFCKSWNRVCARHLSSDSSSNSSFCNVCESFFQKALFWFLLFTSRSNDPFVHEAPETLVVAFPQ